MTILAIDNPDGSLLFSAEEVAAAVSYFKQPEPRWLIGEAASLAQVKAELPAHNVLHFSTHGIAGFSEPLESFLLLTDQERLTLREVLAMDLDQARLAVLSACETGIPGTRLLDEVVSLPTGFLQAGVPGVIGSLWSVNDASTMMLMARFYDFWKGDGKELPEALRQAQIWLRDTTNQEKEAYFKQALPEYAGERMPAATAREALRDVLLKDKQERSFAHPYHWAAFGYTGI